MKMTTSWAVTDRRTRQRARTCAAVAGAFGLLLAGTGAAAAAWAGTAGAAATGSAAAVSAGRWGTAIPVPGLAALNTGGNAAVVSVSCPLAGNCGVGGYYTDRGGHTQGFLVSERNGRWSKAAKVPGLAALNAGGNARVVSVSCTWRGRCGVGGFYTDGSGHTQGFVVSERNGRWRGAMEVPGLAALDAGASATVNSVSCASAGNCAAGGQYGQASGGSQAFVASEKDGVWSAAREIVPPSASTGNASVNSVSCASPGNCTAGGYYPIVAGPMAVGNLQAFVVSETRGVWGTPQVPPGLAALNLGYLAAVNSVSCASAGNCGAAGIWYSYDDGTDDNPGLPNPFVATEKNGHWSAVQVPSSSILAQSEQIYANAVSCPSAGNCTAVGGNDSPAGDGGVYVVSERNGRWGAALPLPGLTALNTTGFPAGSSAVSCASAGNCAVGGFYNHRKGSQAFVVTERNFRWGRAMEVPGTPRLDRHAHAAVTAMSCPLGGRCAIGGYYTDSRGHIQAFIDSQL